MPAEPTSAAHSIRIWILLLCWLAPLPAFAAAPDGSWWNLSYAYRDQIQIPAGTSALQANYAVSLVLDHAAKVSAGRSLASGNDMRIVRWNGSAWVELNRVIEAPMGWNTSATRIWFATAAALSANATDDNYYVYYGNPAAGGPPENGALIFTLWDEFTTALDTTSKWTASDNIDISSPPGEVSLKVNAALQSKTSFGGNTMWEARARTSDSLPGGGDKQYYFWFASNSSAYTGNHAGFLADTDGNFALSRNSAEAEIPINSNTFAYKKYAFAREGTTQLRYSIDDVPVGLHANASNVPTINLPIRVLNDANGTRTMIYDWMRIRPYRHPEPVLTLALGAAPHFVVSHDMSGIHCVGETISVTVLDAANNPLTTYAELVVLDTGTGKGTWSKLTGSGNFDDATSNDGLATYLWPSGASTATFSLYYPEGTATLDVDVYQMSDGTVRDTDTEGTLRFSPSGFTVTSALLANPPPATLPAFGSPQTAGAAFAVHITAYGQTPTDTQCGVIESYTGSKTLEFRSTHVNPGTASVPVTIGSTPLPLNGSAATQSVTFSNGQASVTAKYKDVGSIAVAIRDASASPAINGATGNVIVKPSTFAINVSGVPAPTPTNAGSAKFVAAGAPFSVTVTALDAEGATTPNYGRETPAQSVELLATLMDPSGPGTHNPGVTSVGGDPQFTLGVSTWSYAWPEVGIIRVRPHVLGGKYLNTDDVMGAISSNVGRFHPHAFVLTPNIPIMQTGCTPSTPYSAFSYVGQELTYSLAPRITATAVAVGGTTTENYSGSYFKLDDAGSTTPLAYLPVGTAFTLNASAPPGVLVSELPLGVGELRLDAASGISIARSTPRAPFNAAIRLSVNVLDSDGVTSPAALVIGDPVTGMMFSAGPEQRYGRLAFRNAVGSELLSLAVPLRAEYFVSAMTGFIRNQDDMCSSAGALTLNSFGGRLASSETCVINGTSCSGPAAQHFRSPPTPLPMAVPADGGDFNLWLSAPGVGNDGTVSITAGAPAWLQFDWDASTPGVLENPQGVATFGIYQGSPRRIYQRERVR